MTLFSNQGCQSNLEHNPFDFNPLSFSIEVTFAISYDLKAGAYEFLLNSH